MTNTTALYPPPHPDTAPPPPPSAPPTHPHRGPAAARKAINTGKKWPKTDKEVKKWYKTAIGVKKWYKTGIGARKWSKMGIEGIGRRMGDRMGMGPRDGCLSMPTARPSTTTRRGAYSGRGGRGRGRGRRRGNTGKYGTDCTSALSDI